jgi:hypothetical protein
VATVPISIRLDKSFPYRGNAEIWSNRYHFAGANPVDNVEWGAIVDALVQSERSCYSSRTTVVYAAGYLTDPGVAVFTRDYTVTPNSPVPGTFVPGTLPAATGDDAAWVRWNCGQVTSRGKKIYLRKYFHDVYLNAAGGGDALYTNQKSAIQNHGTACRGGLIVSGHASRLICDKHGNTALDNETVTYVTTRTLKRRSGSPL